MDGWTVMGIITGDCLVQVYTEGICRKGKQDIPESTKSNLWKSHHLNSKSTYKRAVCHPKYQNIFSRKDDAAKFRPQASICFPLFPVQ